jgi:hypothetical protein
MADKVVTPANVLASPNATVLVGIIGAATTIAPGDWIYQDPADDTWKLAKANELPPVSKGVAIALTGGAAGQPVHYVTDDPRFKPGFTIALHEIVIGSGTAAGKFAPLADLTTGWRLTVAMVGTGSNYAYLNFTATGVPAA